MEQNKEKLNSKMESKRFTLACIMIACGIGLIFWGFAVEPVGIISASVLSGSGEILFFAGCLLSLDSYVNFKINKYINKDKNEQDK